MKKYKVTKQIDFCYGHRLMNYGGKCRSLHGHNAILEIDIESDHLNETGMVIDFLEIKKIAKNWLDNNIDHKMLLRKDDPAIKALSAIGEAYYVMEENPTAENIAKLIFNELNKLGLPALEVRIMETETSWASYRNSLKIG